MTVKTAAFALFTALFCACSFASQQQTVEAIAIQRDGLSNLLLYMDNHAEIFSRPNAQNELLNREQKQQVNDVWLLYLDYMSSLAMIAEQTKDYLSLGGNERKERKAVHALAYNAHYRFGMEFIKRIKADPELTKWLNSDVNDTGLPKNFFNRFSLSFVTDWATDNYDDFNNSLRLNDAQEVAAFIEADIAAVKQLNRISMLTQADLSTMNQTLYNIYYPMQKYVARGMGKVKLWRINKTLITPEQALEFSHEMEPGDFYFTRKEWRLTNAGIPGFWTHSALYIGTPFERETYFDTPEVNQWLAEKGYSDFESLLVSVSPVYAQSPGYDENGIIRALEVLDAGAIFNSIQTSLDADGAAVFRPRLSKLDKAKAIYNAFHYAGRPYDFHFDFDSDSALLCSELIYKAYQPAENQNGIEFPLYQAVGKKMLTPSEMARWYDETEGTDEQQLDLVMFIDSNEDAGVAFVSTAEAFTGSWQRSDWYIFQQPPYQPDDEQLASNQAGN